MDRTEKSAVQLVSKQSQNPMSASADIIRTEQSSTLLPYIKLWNTSEQ